METTRALTALPGVRRLLARWLRPSDPSLQVDALGLRFPGPLGVAGGLDKGARWFDALGVLGFGFVEVGTVTAQPQEGNPKPRVFRLGADRALLNSLGFPNPGAGVIAERLRTRRGDTIVAANIGKSKPVALEQAGADYRRTTRAVAPHADLIVVNVSSPNTPGLRDMQAVSSLGPLIADVRDELRRLGRPLPVLIKVSPDLSDDDLDAIADLALKLRIEGIVATNTTISRAGLRSPAALTSRPGGVSGAPLRERSLQVLRRLHARTGGQLVLVSVGGIETAADVWERVLAGATLVQAYTGFVYGGPLWAHRVNRDLLRLMRDNGCASLGEAALAGSRRAALTSTDLTSSELTGTDQ